MRYAERKPDSATSLNDIGANRKHVNMWESCVTELYPEVSLYVIKAS
ncbi:14596_t:CDS:2 [Funneliformis geosporum]|nr:14596_t:CDS:2 [Funneliformis geosporum]